MFTFVAEFTEMTYRQDDSGEEIVHCERRKFKTLSGVMRVYNYWRNNDKQIVAMSIVDRDGNTCRQFRRNSNLEIELDRQGMEQDFVFVLVENEINEGQAIKGAFTSYYLAEDALVDLETKNGNDSNFKYWIDKVPLNEVL